MYSTIEKECLAISGPCSPSAIISWDGIHSLFGPTHLLQWLHRMKDTNRADHPFGIWRYSLLSQGDPQAGAQMAVADFLSRNGGGGPQAGGLPGLSRAVGVYVARGRGLAGSAAGREHWETSGEKSGSSAKDDHLCLIAVLAGKRPLRGVGRERHRERETETWEVSADCHGGIDCRSYVCFEDCAVVALLFLCVFLWLKTPSLRNANLVFFLPHPEAEPYHKAVLRFLAVWLHTDPGPPSTIVDWHGRLTLDPPWVSCEQSASFFVGCNNEHSSRHLLLTSEPLKTQMITFVSEGNAPPDLPKCIYVCANHSWFSFTYRRSEYKVCFYESLLIAFPNNMLLSKFRG